MLQKMKLVNKYMALVVVLAILFIKDRPEFGIWFVLLLLTSLIATKVTKSLIAEISFSVLIISFLGYVIIYSNVFSL